MAPRATLPLLLTLACTRDPAPEHDTADSADSGGYTHETADTGILYTQNNDPPALGCADWEDGTLRSFSYGDADFVELMDGAIVANVGEGGDWSALRGEERIPISGDRAVILRSSHEGDPDSMASGTLGPFRVEQPALTWLQLSEVRAEGLWLGAELLDEDGAPLAQAEVPVETGGFVPGLQRWHAPIDGLDEIVVGEGAPGEPVAQGLDMSPWMGGVVQVRFSQHTRIDDNGFFTLLDDLCGGEGADLELLSWETPTPIRPTQPTRPEAVIRPSTG